ncbi:hypothetical protein TSUD_174280 [Trifolium subterraneum]|nr:hypothetical protein TSUD_174280 [Trifolium subterraneum]
MVRTTLILPDPIPGIRFINRFDSPPTAGHFTKVPSKPTNHSKFTGKCCTCTSRFTGCRLHPVSKLRIKSKGNSKHLRFVDQPDSKLDGLSATRTLNYITNCYMDDAEGEDEKVDYVDNYVN